MFPQYLTIKEADRRNSGKKQVVNMEAKPEVKIVRSKQEIDRMRQQGLCFTCKQKWKSGHKCDKAKFVGISLIVEDDEDEVSTSQENVADAKPLRIMKAMNTSSDEESPLNQPDHR
ncbi:hypothetical protein O6H91_Y006700 [Diphasiastrum complanatum]|nr:hypothetical protein O6H91_Y006700 [Diphasiastrum complanatum]